MSPSAIPPVVHRALLAVALFTFASWVLIAAALLAWAPGRGLAAGAVARMARAASVVPGAAPLATVAMSDLAIPCASSHSYSYSVDDDRDAPDFAWYVTDGNGEVWIDGGGSRRSYASGRNGTPRFWFRDHDDEFIVRDPALVAEVREAVRPLRDVGREMGAVGAEMGRHGARMGRMGGRMGAMSARMALIEARLANGAVSDERRADVDASLKGMRTEMADLRTQMEREQSAHRDEQQELSHRMSELSARHHQVMLDVRTKVRAISERARREGKAERPHANA